MNHGNADGQCSACHPGGGSNYSCTNCHSGGDFEEEHRDEGINDLSNCLGCHPGGQEGDDVNGQVMVPADGLTVNNDGSGLGNYLLDMAASLSFLALIAVFPGVSDRFGRI
jgi:hypothetical protein